MFCTFTKANTMNTVCMYVYTKTHGLDGCSYISVKLQVCLIMTGRLVDTHLGSYVCKLNTMEGSHCSTTKKKKKKKNILNVFLLLLLLLLF